MKCSKKISRIAVMLGASLLATLCFALAVFAARTDPEHWFTDKEPVEDFAFSFVVVGDTQNITQGRSQMLHTIFDYIVDNREAKKTAHVFHMGDIATDYVTDEEWQVAAAAIGKMDGVIPYTLTRGNHDAKAQYEKYVCTEAYKSQFEGFFRKGESANSYRLFSVCGNDFLILTLDHGPSDRVLTWAKKIIETYPERKVILVTHGYLAADGTPLDYKDKYAPTAEENPQGVINNGDHMWDKLISKYENIFMVLCGHINSDDVVVSQSVGDHGNVVTQILVDNQYLDNDIDAGIVVQLYFSNDGKTVSVEQYSTLQKKFYRRQSQFDITVPEFSTVEPPPPETTAEETTALPEEPETTAAPETEADGETTTESAPAKSGCRSSIGGMTMLAVLPMLLPILFARTKKSRR